MPKKPIKDNEAQVTNYDENMPEMPMAEAPASEEETAAANAETAVPSEEETANAEEEQEIKDFVDGLSTPDEVYAAIDLLYAKLQQLEGNKKKPVAKANPIKAIEEEMNK